MTATKALVQVAAEQYLSRGWCAIPVPARSKNPNRRKWQDERYTLSDVKRAFSAGDNIGIHCGAPSDGLCDVDLDVPEAVHLAPHFLAPTDRRHGRETNPSSHWWYVCDPVPDGVEAFREPGRKGKKLIELRSTGGQTIVPPSIHPDGDQYIWEAKGDAAEIDGRILRHDVARLAACTLLARSWVEGARHDLALAVAGGLLRSDWPAEEVAEFIELASRAAGDLKQVREHRQAVYDTAQRVSQDRKATGIPTLAEIMGDDLADRFLDWLGIRFDRASIILDSPNGTRATTKPATPEPESEPEEPEWAIPDDAPAVQVRDLPYWLERFVRHVEPYTPMFPDDWPIMMSLPFWSILWPNVRIQNLNLAIWSLGLSVQSAGKNLATDELVRVTRIAADNDVQIYTSGSPEGIFDRLDGIGKQMLAYHDEYGGFLKTMNRDYMAQAKQSFCSLYDGRIASHWRAQKQNVLVVDPVVAVVATTTPADLQRWGDPDDMLSGYLSRFMFCVPNRRKIVPDMWGVDDSETRQELAREINMFRNRLRGVLRLRFMTPDGRDPDIIEEFMEHHRMNTGELVVLEDEMNDRSIPAGRLLARIKKIAGLLALAEREPRLSGDGRTAYIEDEHVAQAAVIVERGAFYAARAMAWIGVNEEVRLSDRVLNLLLREPVGLTQRELCRRLNAKASEMNVALALLRDAGQVLDMRVKGSRAVHWQTVNLRGMQ